MSRFYSGKLVMPYILLFLVFYIIFGKIEPIYLKANCLCNAATNYPIDTRASKGGFFDAQYVRTEARDCYDISGYFRSFFPLDMVFPLVYSFMMLSIVNFSQLTGGRKILVYSIWIGMALDYCEDISFAFFLTTKIPALAMQTAIFTTLKTFLFILNLVACIALIVWRLTIKSADKR